MYDQQFIESIAEKVADVVVAEDALERIVKETGGYPYFLQEWGKQAWDTAPASPIALRDVKRASKTAIAALDQSFFRVRFDRLTPVEKRYLSVEEAAAYSGYSVGALWKHIQRQHLPVSKEGTSTRVDKVEIDRWMLRNRQ